ncbi:MAG: LysM peptidoglycan-binding domain-containing protein [Saprospiraceae bacterium]|nr:LysM peptidoglycan-binding domain-containing protein [Saprospiraceae bacterium]MDW8228530.1 LysM peptidoglycan-binding domain-containing protein [Saprospiraceae bacterium]
MRPKTLVVLWLISQLAASAQRPLQLSKGAEPVLTWRDSVLLTVENGQKYLHHIVKPGHTLFSLTRFYGLSLEELYYLNPALQQDPMLRVGTLLKIPIPNRAIRRYEGAFFERQQFAQVFYVVQPGDNLFHVSKRLFDMPMDSMRLRNRLHNDHIHPGQMLHVGWIGLEGIPAEWRSVPITETLSEQTHRDRFEEDKKRLKEYSSQGVCFWNRESNEKGDFYALHREAAVGSTIAVTNPMSRITVYARVIGRIPSTYEPNIEVILSPAAARQLRALDPRFFVQTRYLK